MVKRTKRSCIGFLVVEKNNLPGLPLFTKNQGNQMLRELQNYNKKLVLCPPQVGQNIQEWTK